MENADYDISIALLQNTPTWQTKLVIVSEKTKVPNGPFHSHCFSLCIHLKLRTNFNMYYKQVTFIALLNAGSSY